jgi:uncharacterized protein (TIGR02145 family)
MENLDTSNWASKNLDVDHFRNGDKIPEAKTAEEWDEAEYYRKPAWCYYDNDPENGKIYGKLYNRYAVSDKRCLAPDGWHIPSDEEWTELENLLGEEAGKKLKSKNGWKDSGNGTDLIGFNALPGGYRIDGYHFDGIGKYTHFWCAENDNNESSTRILGYDFGDVRNGKRVYTLNEPIGFYVRCVLDKD